MSLAEFWFFLIAFFFVGYFVLEGFDFGVGMLLPVLGRDDIGRRVLINTIGPFWDANETWLIVAGASMFAAFPYWYATMFSGFYLPLLLLLVALILRGVAFEYRGKVDAAAWRRRWDAAIVFGSVVPPLLWGVAFANFVRGVAIDADGNVTSSVFSLLNPYALVGGVTTLALFLTHGAIFVTLKTVGPVRHEARRLAAYSGAVSAILVAAFLIWTNVAYGTLGSVVLSIVGFGALAAALLANRARREGWAFTLTAVTVTAVFAALFAALYPDVLPSRTDPALSLTIENASSTPRTLALMSWIAVGLTPFVLLYEGYSYWVFRQRIGRDNIPTRLPHGAANVLGQ